MAMGFWSIGAMVAPAVGPFLGGYLVDEVDWRSIFYINLPVGAVATWRPSGSFLLLKCAGRFPQL